MAHKLQLLWFTNLDFYAIRTDFIGDGVGLNKLCANENFQAAEEGLHYFADSYVKTKTVPGKKRASATA